MSLAMLLVIAPPRGVKLTMWIVWFGLLLGTVPIVPPPPHIALRLYQIGRGQ